MLAAALVAPLALFGCATGPGDAEVSAKAAAVMKASFREQGQAKLDRLDQDDMQKTCSEYSGKALPKEAAARIEKENLATIKWPADGKLLGDWRAGEKIAQDGRGMSWSDKGGVGGSCYNCHQIGPRESSFGTVGPSLYQFGKLRGYGADIQRYAYGKIYNAKAYNLCSQMPRMGHVGALTEEQMKDLTALLMDPASPVNQ
jgi:sulfur-oxidizing protein SoxX